MNSQHSETGEALRRSLDKLDATKKLLEQQLGDSERALRQELSDKSKEANERVPLRGRAGRIRNLRDRSGCRWFAGREVVARYRPETKDYYSLTGSSKASLKGSAPQVDQVERHHANTAKEARQRLNTMELRMCAGRRGLPDGSRSLNR